MTSDPKGWPVAHVTPAADDLRDAAPSYAELVADNAKLRAALKACAEYLADLSDAPERDCAGEDQGFCGSVCDQYGCMNMRLHQARAALAE